MADSHIIKEKKRLRALSQHIIDTHGHCIYADSVMLVHCERQFQLRADSICSADKDRLLHIQSRKVEHSSERPDIAHHSETGSGCYMRLDPADHLISGFKVYTCFFVTFCHNIEFLVIIFYLFS